MNVAREIGGKRVLIGRLDVYLLASKGASGGSFWRGSTWWYGRDIMWCHSLYGLVIVGEQGRGALYLIIFAGFIRYTSC